jgi:phosphoenolpyruvate-protein kinase (PTS system EI component)
VDEQVRIYKKAYELFPDGAINFRILDLGADKFISTGSCAVARHAFHGYRSLRVLFDHPDVLRDQVRALAIAAERCPPRWSSRQTSLARSPSCRLGRTT